MAWVEIDKVGPKDAHSDNCECVREIRGKRYSDKYLHHHWDRGMLGWLFGTLGPREFVQVKVKPWKGGK